MSCRGSEVDLTVIFQVNEPQTKISLRNSILKEICFYNLNQQVKLNDLVRSSRGISVNGNREFVKQIFKEFVD